MKDSKVDRKAEADPVEFARTIALNALASRPKSRHELETQLERRGVANEISALVLDRLALVGLINDREFAEAWSRSRVRAKGLSRRVLARELRAKGIEQEIADAVLAEITPEDEYSAALSIATKKARSTTELPREVQVRRIFDLLARKGFSSSISTRIIKEILEP